MTCRCLAEHPSWSLTPAARQDPDEVHALHCRALTPGSDRFLHLYLPPGPWMPCVPRLCATLTVCHALPGPAQVAAPVLHQFRCELRFWQATSGRDWLLVFKYDCQFMDFGTFFVLHFMEVILLLIFK